MGPFDRNSLNSALVDIATMRNQMARATQFRGYGPVTLAATGVVAMIAAAVQHAVLPQPLLEVQAYLAIWTVTAAFSVLVIGIETATRTQRLHSGLANEMILQAIEQFLPAALAGVLLALVLVRSAPETVWMLPGLWQIILSLGVFAACRSLPASLLLVGIWYLASGLACLMLATGAHALSPLAMGVPFAVGQLLAAALLQIAGARHDEI
jgi:hypothetical protein